MSTSSDQNQSTNMASISTLMSISGTMSSIGLALVGIISAKASIDHTQTIADDMFLFSSIGFLVVLAIGYLAQKNVNNPRYGHLLTLAEWIVTISIVLMVSAGFVMVYTTV